MKIRFLTFAVLFTATLFFVSCDENKKVDYEDDSELTVIKDEVLDSAQSLNTSINGKMFSIPSPIQMATLIKSKVNTYDEANLTSSGDASNFTTTFKRAINMGIYGADLGYATIYENNTKAISYLTSIEKISEELGIAGAFDEGLLGRFIENGNNQDSMLVIMSEGYREGDKFLKDNEQRDVASLILTGGWIESLFFAANAFESTKDQDIANRIGEQKTALKTIIALLEDNSSSDEYVSLIADLTDLKIEFDQIKFNYQYIDPVHNTSSKTTQIKSKSSVNLEEIVLGNIIEKIKKIRQDLIG